MKVLGERFVFAGEVPEPTQIAQAVARLSGLEVVVDEAAVELPGYRFRYWFRIAFQCLASEGLFVSSIESFSAPVLDESDPRAQAFQEAREMLIELRKQAAQPPPLPRPQGEWVRLSSPAREEPSLRVYVCRALELLGGVRHPARGPATPIGPISPAELQARLHRHRRKLRRNKVLGCLMLPWFALYILLLVPWALWGAVRTLYRTRGLRARLRKLSQAQDR